MPDKNGTGPTGKGPMTGRGSGKCIVPLNTPEEELAYLKNQEKIMLRELETIQARIAFLNKIPEKE